MASVVLAIAIASAAARGATRMRASTSPASMGMMDQPGRIGPRVTVDAQRVEHLLIERVIVEPRTTLIRSRAAGGRV